MKKLMSRLTIALASAFLLAGASGTALAQSGSDDEEKTKETVAMSQQVYEKLAEIQELIEAKDYATAERQTVELRDRKGLSDYELAQIWNITAYSYYLQERYDDAIRAYDQVLAQPGLPEALMQSTLKTKSQLMFTQEDYEGALEVIRELMAIIPEPSADVLMIEGQALFQLARYDEALVPIKTAIDMYREQGQKPKENWLLLLRVIYFEQKDYENMLEVVKELIAYYPKDTYVLTLAGIYSELGDTKKQLALTEVLYDQGMLNTSSHITNLANLYLVQGKKQEAIDKFENALATNPMMPGTPGRVQGWQRSSDDDFDEFFTANPELILRGIGLQPEAFRDFRSPVANWPYDRAWAKRFAEADDAASALAA